MQNEKKNNITKIILKDRSYHYNSVLLFGLNYDIDIPSISAVCFEKIWINDKYILWTD